MRGIICYYSSTGNTRLACRYIARRIEEVKLDLFDVTKGKAVELEGYDVVGFATFTDFWGPPYLFKTFVEGLPQQSGKPAFVFNTYGNRSGRTLKTMESIVSARGFQVIAGHSLHTPESYPPMIARGKGNEHAPTEEEKLLFEEFVADLRQLLGSLEGKGTFRGNRIRVGLLNSVLPTLPRTMARRDMGEKYVDELVCTECGVCEKMCPYEAIRLDPKPVFNLDECYGCWACYNRCPEQAIYTRKYRGVGHYPKPLARLKEAFRA